MTQTLWTPSVSRVAQSNITRYVGWLEDELALRFPDYHDLWKWSVDNPGDFWASIGRYFDVPWHDAPTAVLTGGEVMSAAWFPGGTLNYAEVALRNVVPGKPAVISCGERGERSEMSWEVLEEQVHAFAGTLRELGIRSGDRVVAYMPNIVEAVVAFLGCAAVGAVWSVCSLELAAEGAEARLAQLAPRLLVAGDGYWYGGKVHDRRSQVAALVSRLPELRAVVTVDHVADDWTGIVPEGLEVPWRQAIGHQPADRRFEPVPFDHPLWILFSSGTTGPPKGIVHGHGGIVLEHLKYLGLHNDLGPHDRFFWYTSTNWMMWNVVVGGLLVGATVVTYDGSPVFPRSDRLWALAEALRITFLGTSASYIMNSAHNGDHPAVEHDLHTLRALGSTASPLPPSGYEWVYGEVKSDIWLAAASGGTDVCAPFVGGVPTLPVRSGEMQARCLGVSVECWSPQGTPLLDEVGELVVTKAMPSMPLRVWGDESGARLRQTYFSMFPGIWRHGDWLTITHDGAAVIHGRSDATLNRLGVRLGTGPIYDIVESFEEIADSLLIGVEESDGGYYMPLFVVLGRDQTLNSGLVSRIRVSIRERLSPRHVPEEIISVPSLPHTLNGKKLEVPIKRLYQGVSLDDAISVASVDDQAALLRIAELAAAHRAAAKVARTQ